MGQPQTPQQRPPPQNNLSKGANLFVKEIRARIDAYFKIAVRNVRDTIPKTIGYFLVKSSQERLQFELYSQINKNEQLQKSLGEPERVAEERKSLSAILETLRKAIKVLQRDPDITNTAFGEDELEEQLKLDAMQRRREEEQKKFGGSSSARDPNMSMNAGQNNMGGPGGPPGQMPPQQRPPSNMGNPVGPPGGVRPMGIPPGGMPQGGAPPGGVRPPGPGVPLNNAAGTGTLFGNPG